MKNKIHSNLYGDEYNGNYNKIISIALLVFMVPLIVHGKMFKLTGDYFKYWNGSAQSFDFFSYYKSVFIMILVGISVIIFIYKLFIKEININKNNIYIPMGIYLFSVILSSLFSDFKDIAIWGFVERYEGMITILSYMIILFISINLIIKKKYIKAILISLICSAVIIGLIGIFQYVGHDFFKINWVKEALLPSEYKNMAHKLKFQFGEKIIYSTLYHYNYVGSYMAMLFPLTFTMFLFVKNKACKITIGLVSVLMFLNLILCHSRAGIIGGIVSIVVLLIFIRNFIVKNYKYFVASLLICIVALVGFNVYSKGSLFNRIGSLFSDAGDLAKNSNYYIKDIYSEKNTLKIETSKGKLTLVSEKNKLNFKDEKNNVLAFSINQQTGQVSLQNDNYNKINLNLKGYSTKQPRNRIKVKISDVEIPLLIDNDKFKFEDKRRGELELRKIDRFGFEGKEKLGSARGYIWSRSIPLIKDNVLLGSGPDTVAARFPQDDFIGKTIAYGTPKMLVDKVHNLYLQQAINTGVISLLAFLAMFIMYFVSCCKLYFKREFSDFYSIVGLAIFTAVCGYLGAGFFNDSVVSVAPVFWVLFGMGIAINHKLSSKKEDIKNNA